MKRRNFIKDSAKVGSGFLILPLGHTLNSNAMALNPWVWRLGKYILRLCRDYLVTEMIIDPLFTKTIGSKPSSFLKQKEYLPSSGFPVLGYNYSSSDVNESGKFEVNKMERKSSGFNGHISFTNAKMNADGKVSGTQSTFVFTSQKSQQVVAMLSESELFVVIGLYEKYVSLGFSPQAILSILLPYSSGAMMDEHTMDKYFLNKNYATVNGLIEFDNEVIYGNGKQDFPTKIKSSVSFIPNEVSSTSGDLKEHDLKLLNKEFTENDLVIDVEDVLSKV